MGQINIAIVGCGWLSAWEFMNLVLIAHPLG